MSGAFTAFALAALSGPAQALELDRLDLDALRDGLIPELEQSTGRAFVDVPPVHVVDREELYQRVLEGELAVRGLMGLDNLTPADLASIQDLTSDAIGLYTYADRQIYLVTSGVEDLFANWVVPDDLYEPLVRCVLSHELVHALQHQYQPHPTLEDASREPVARMLREGHANVVSRPFCTDQSVQRFFRFNDGLDVLAVRGTGEELPFLYGYGERYVDLLIDRHGTEAAWWALSEPPPSRDQVGAAVDPLLLQGWRESGLVDDAARRLMWPTAQGQVQPASPAELLQGQLGTAGVTGLASTQAGWLFTADEGPRSLTLMAFAFADETEALQQLSYRRSDLAYGRGDGGELSFFGEVGVYSGKFKVRAPKKLTQPVDDAFETRILVDGQRHYLESWAVRGGLLVAVAAVGTEHRSRDLAEALDLILARDPPTRPPPDAPGGPLGLAVPATLPAPTPSWEYPFLQVFRDINAEQWQACLAGVADMMPSAPDHAREQVARVGWTCGLAGEDPDAASHYLDQLSNLQELDHELLIGHAALYSQQRRWKDCLAHLVRLEEAGVVLPAEAVDLKIACLVETGALTQATAAARQRLGTPSMRVQVAYALVNADRLRQALPILEEACPKLRGQERTQCGEVQRDLASWLR